MKNASTIFALVSFPILLVFAVEGVVVRLQTFAIAQQEAWEKIVNSSLALDC